MPQQNHTDEQIPSQRREPNWQSRERHHSIGGGAGHWVRTIGVLAPLIIGEVVKNPDQRWRFIRITSVAMALISEGLYAHKVQQQKREREEYQR